MRGKNLKLAVFLWLLLSASMIFSMRPHQVQAAINPQINFQGKLTNPDDTNVTDGTYSIVFSIYSVASGGTAVWTETQSSTTVTAGIFQVSLGSITAFPGSVDFNSSAIYLGIKVGSDAEMTPRTRFTAAPFAFNSDRLDGISSAGYVQLGQSSSAQTDASTNSSIFINKTNASGNIFQLQKTASDVFVVSNSGAITATSTYNTNTFSSSSLQFGAAGSASIQSAASQALNITGNAASTFSTSAGSLVLQGFSGVTVNTPNTTGASTSISMATGNSTTAGATGTLNFVTGNATSGTAGNISFDVGTSSSGNGSILIGTASRAQTITIGNSTGATNIGHIVGAGTNVFNIQGASSAIYMQLDTTNNRLYVGNPTADATGFVFVFDSKNTAGDPTVVNGAEYYNSLTNKLRCNENSIWQDCSTGFNTITKTSNQAATQSSTIMQDDNTLVFSVNANTTYVFDAWIPVDDSNATADLKYTFTTPASSTLSIMTNYNSTATSNVICNIIVSGTACANTTVNQANHFIQIRGHVSVAGTAGSVQFRFAQNTSTAVSFPVIEKGATLSWHQSN